jgi:hypothetical protein
MEEGMTAMSWVVSAAFLILVGSGPVQSATDANVDPAKAQITVLYDAFGQTSGMQRDWAMPLLSNMVANAFCSIPETSQTFLRTMRRQKESTSLNWISWLCHTAMGTTWEG